MSATPHAPTPGAVKATWNDGRLDDWRTAHWDFVRHIINCLDCGVDLCGYGQNMWDAADSAEEALGWWRGN